MKSYVVYQEMHLRKKFVKVNCHFSFNFRPADAQPTLAINNKANFIVKENT